MKKTMITVAAAVMMLLAPKADAMHILFRQTAAAIPAQTNFVPVVNATGQVIGTNVTVTPAVVPQFEMNPTVDSALKTGQTVTEFLPPPYGTVASGALMAVSAILGFFLKKKNGQLSTTQTILQSVVTGVEAVGDATTKLSIQSHANAAGVQTQLNPIVQAVTANSPGTLLTAAPPAK
jgi:hypothetical protein